MKQLTCERCGIKFIGVRARFCGAGCMQAARLDKIKAEEAPDGTFNCGYCGKEFHWWKKINSTAKRFCSQRCSAKVGTGKGSHKGRNDISKLTEVPTSIDRLTHCRKKTGPFVYAVCKHYWRWQTELTQFHCKCEEGLTL